MDTPSGALSGTPVFGDPSCRLYPVIDQDACDARGLDPLRVAAACLDGGARILQLRVKRASSAAFLALAEAMTAAAASRRAALIVNDRPDIARLAGADGVHVGQEDLSPAAARRVLGRGVIGLSTHDERQVDEGLASTADYVAVGPVFETGTKDTGYAPRGLRLVRYAAGRGRPVVAIGGIDLDRAPAVIAAGAAAVAVISDLLGESTEGRVRQYLRALG